MLSADLILVNGNVITMDPVQPKAQAVAVRKGIVEYVGSDEEALQLKDRKTAILDLRKKTLLPGFIESHVHPLSFGLSLLEIECRAPEVNSIHKLLENVRAASEKTPKGEWLRGRGWDDSKLTDWRYPNRWDLDKVAPMHPVFLKRTCGHIAVVNSKALEICGIDENTPDPEGGHIARDPASGALTGIVEERAQELFPTPVYTEDEYREGMLLAQKQFAQWGFTTIHDIAVEEKGLLTYQTMLAEGSLALRLRFWLFAIKQMRWQGTLDKVIALGIKSGFGNDMLKFQGMKFILDGSVGGRTAAVAEPYEGDPDNRGTLFTSEAVIIPEVVQCLKAGLRVAIHGIGERSIEIALKAMEASSSGVDVSAMRNRIEHCGLPTDQHLDRMKKMGVIAGSSVGFIYNIGDSYYKNLGPERMKRVYPHRSFIDRGIVAPGNSDCPVTCGNPLWGIYGAVTRKTIGGQVVDREQNISVYEALKAYTVDAAYASFEENKIGSISADKYADLIVLSHDPFHVPAESLKDIQVELTMLNGEKTYSCITF